jgi:hypothetical protein
MLRSSALATHLSITGNPRRHRSAVQLPPVRVADDADVFVFDSSRRADDWDVIADFRPGADKIDLSRTVKFAGADFDELLAAADQVEGDVVIDMGQGTLTLEDVDLGDLEADDFIF